jgi:ferritin
VVSQTIQEALNQQINAEFNSSYTYLSMSAYCERQHFDGSARWLRLQSREEIRHGMRLFDFLLARNCRVTLDAIQQPPEEFPSLLALFETALKQEEDVSRRIERLYELAFDEKAFATLVELQWFLTEQVGEERAALDIVTKLRMVREDPAALLELDREFGARESA